MGCRGHSWTERASAWAYPNLRPRSAPLANCRICVCVSYLQLFLGGDLDRTRSNGAQTRFSGRLSLFNAGREIGESGRSARLMVFDSARWHSSSPRLLQALDWEAFLRGPSNPVQLRSLRRRVETRLRPPMTTGASEQRARHCRSALAIDLSRGRRSCRRDVSRRR